jgi:hypothetical protein
MLFSRMKGPPNQRVCQLLDFGYFFICSKPDKLLSPT